MSRSQFPLNDQFAYVSYDLVLAHDLDEMNSDYWLDCMIEDRMYLIQLK